MKRFKFAFAAIALMLMLAFFMPSAWAAYSVKHKLFSIGGTAGEALTTGDVVCIKDADGLVWKADGNVSTLRPALGVVGLGGAAAGDPVEVVVIGTFRGFADLSEGANLYLSETAGAVTQSAPAWAQKAGVALSTTEVFFNFQNYFDTSTLTTLGVLTGATPLYGEGAVANEFEWLFAPEEPTQDNTYVPPDISGAVPLIIAQGYTQTSNGDAADADVTGSSITLPDGWFTEGKTIKYTLGGTVTGANGTISVKLYFEDGAVMTLTSADGAAGDWMAEFTIIATGAATQRVIGRLMAEAGAEVITDYATDTTNTAAAGTIPVKAQITLADAADVITSEYVRIEAWSKAD